MMTTITHYYPLTMLLAYFMFLFGILYMTQNAQSLAHTRRMKALVDRVQGTVCYNLRDIPRIDYRETGKDDNDDDDDQEEEKQKDTGQYSTPDASDEESDVVSDELDQTPRKRNRELEALADRVVPEPVRYNLRPLPDVNYKETCLSDDESTHTKSDASNEESDQEVVHQTLVKRRREPMSRLIDSIY